MNYFNSLSNKISFSLIISVIIVMILFGIYDYKRQEKNFYDSISNEADITENRISYSLSIPMLNKDMDQVKIIIKNEIKNYNIIGIEVYNEYSELIYTVIKDYNNVIFENIEEDVINKYIKKAFLKKEVPITKGIDIIGTIHVYFTDYFLKERLTLIILQTVLQVFILTVIIVIVSYFNVKRIIIDKILVIDETLKQFKNKEFSVRIKDISNDELGSVAINFNEMAETIENYSNNLEELVRIRTAELQRANDIMKKELQIAKNIQEAILPKNLVNEKIVEIFGAYIPMEEVGGDFYDVYKISDSKIGIIVADVSGHGVPAALITMMAKVMFKNNSVDQKTTAEIVSSVNKELCRVLSDIENYLTVFYGIIDLNNFNFQYTNAGHSDVLLLKNNGDFITMNSQSTFIGKIEDLDFISDNIKIDKGDKIILFTDGVIECRNEKKEFYGEERFKNILLKNRNLSAKDMVCEVIKDINNFKNNTYQNDDISLLIVEIKLENNKLSVDIGKYNSL